MLQEIWQNDSAIKRDLTHLGLVFRDGKCVGRKLNGTVSKVLKLRLAANEKEADTQHATEHCALYTLVGPVQRFSPPPPLPPFERTNSESEEQFYLLIL